MKKIIIFIIYIIIPYLIFSASHEEMLQEALSLENKGQYNVAADLFYRIFKETGHEEYLLKCARLLPSYQDAVFKYREYIVKYQDSKYINIVYFELAELHKLYEKYDLALHIYRNLADKEKEGFYYEKAIFNCALQEFNLARYADSTVTINEILGIVKDYNTVSSLYYLLGMNLIKQDSPEDGKKFLLICGLNFPQSMAASSALIELGRLYLNEENKEEAIRFFRLVKKLYPDSLEAKYANDVLKKRKITSNLELPELNAIKLSETYELNSLIADKIIVDMNESQLKKNKTFFNKKNVESAFYIQCAYLTSEENARFFVLGMQKKGLLDIYYARTRSKDGKSVYYRVLMGPFKSREAINKKIIELKESNIETIMLELKKVYE